MYIRLLVTAVAVCVSFGTGLIGPVAISHAQGNDPFTKAGEEKRLGELDQFRENKAAKNKDDTLKIAPLTPVTPAKSIYDDEYQQPLTAGDATTRRNGLDSTTQNNLYYSDPFAQDQAQNPVPPNPTAQNQDEQRRDNFARFEANGGQLRNVDLVTERRQDRAEQARAQRLEVVSGDPLERNQRLTSDGAISIEGDEPEGNEGQGDRTRRRFEEEEDNFAQDFTEAERALQQEELAELAGDDARDANGANQQQRDGAQRGRQAGARQGGRQARGRRGQNNAQNAGRGQGNRNNRPGARRTAQNDGDDNQADNNDITGSIRNNDLEDTYAPIGKRIGTFLLFPEVTITGIYSDNPTASPTNSPGDFAIEFVPHFVMRSDWTRHSMEFEGQMTKSYFDELTSENVEEWFLRATGRVDIRNNQYLELETRIENGQDDRGDVANLNTPGELATFQTLALTALYNIEFNRTTLQFRGNLTDYDYEDIADGTGGILNNDDQDYLETNASVRLAYTFNPGFYLYTEGSYVDQDYGSDIDDTGFQRSNNGYTIKAGAIYDLTSHIRLEGSIGNQWINADDRRFVDVSDVIYTASLIYRPTRQTSLTIATERGLDSTDLDGTVAVLETTYSLQLEHYLRPHIIFSTGLNYEIEEFQGVNVEQNTLTATVGLQYILNRHARIITSYQFSDIETDGGGSYQENLFRIGMNLRP